VAGESSVRRGRGRESSVKREAEEWESFTKTESGDGGTLGQERESGTGEHSVGRGREGVGDQGSPQSGEGVGDWGSLQPQSRESAGDWEIFRQGRERGNGILSQGGSGVED
jgi:hypothetical protein